MSMDRVNESEDYLEYECIWQESTRKQTLSLCLVWTWEKPMEQS